MKEKNLLLGITFLICGVLVFLRGLRYDKSAMGGLKYRALLTGLISIIGGLVLIFS